MNSSKQMEELRKLIDENNAKIVLDLISLKTAEYQRMRAEERMDNTFRYFLGCMLFLWFMLLLFILGGK